MVEKPRLAGSGRVSARTAPRPENVPGTVEAVQHGTRTVEGQSAGSAVEAYAMVRDPANARGPMNTAHGIAGGPTGVLAEPAIRETFAALDAQAAPGMPTWMQAGGRRAEAGFEDPALGWIGVRAEMDGGGIHASLVPGSPDAAHALGGHLAGLNAYLTEQQTPVETLTLAAPEGRGANAGAEHGASQGMHQGPGQDAQQQSHAETQSDPQPGAPAIPAAAVAEVSAQADLQTTTAQVRGPEGGHISVMA